MLKCDHCGNAPVYRLRIEKGLGYCDKCARPRASNVSVSDLGKTVILRPGDGTEMRTTQAEINEIKRLRMLPYNKEGGGWYPGRMGDNGKIQERYLRQ